MNKKLPVCSKCRVDKTADQFHKDKNRKNGLNARCKECRHMYQKKHYAENRDKKRKQWIKYYAENKDVICARNRKYNHDHPIESRRNSTKYYQKIKRTVIDHYAPDLKCQMCGMDYYPCLTLDHKNGDGHKTRYSTGTWLAGKIIKDNFPDTFQVLCASCNTLKGTLTDAEFRAKHKELINRFRR